MKFLVSFAAALVAFSVPIAGAQEVDSIGGNQSGTQTTEVAFVGVNEVVGSSGFVADVGADRAPEGLKAAAVEPVCVSLLVVVVGELPECVGYVFCFGERVDDVYTGRISGREVAGGYGEYLTATVNALAGIDALSSSLEDPAASVSDALISTSIGSAPSVAALPVFSYCRDASTLAMVTSSDQWGPSFSWSTTVEAEYPVELVSAGLFDELVELLELEGPEIGSAPPAESGLTWVRFPNWFWVESADGGNGDRYLWAESDLETIRIAARAIVEHVEWGLVDDSLVCAPGDMRAYVAGTDPTEDIPVCSFVFDDVGEFELTATITYRIEQQISVRSTRLVPFSDSVWEPHPIRPTVQVTTSAGNITIGELNSLNVLATTTNQ